MRAAWLVIVLCAAPPALAGPDDKAAAIEAYTEGARLFDLRRFREALAAFERSYLKFESPALLYNIAQCHKALGEFGEAKNFYETYLRMSPDASDRAEVERTIAELSAQLARPFAPPAPAAAEKAPAEGAQAPRVQLEAAPAAPPAEVARPVSPASLVAPPPPSVAPPLRSRRGLAIGLAIGGAVVVAAGVGLGLAFGLPARGPTPSDGTLTIPGCDATFAAQSAVRARGVRRCGLSKRSLHRRDGLFDSRLRRPGCRRRSNQHHRLCRR